MPCYQPDAYDIAQSERHNQEIRTMAYQYDRLVQIICTACKEMERNGVPIPTADLVEWWNLHKKSPGHFEE